MRIPFLLLALLSLESPSHSQTPTGVPSIAVVHTWGDLIATKPIHFEGIPQFAVLPQKAQTSPAPAGEPPFRVWVGIDRDEVAAHGAIVLYCLTKNIRFLKSSEDVLGPFHIEVKVPQQVQKLADLVKPIMQNVRETAYTLYARSVPVDGPGEVVIELTDSPKDMRAPHIYARIKMHVLPSKNSHPWSPWDESGDEARTLPVLQKQASAGTVADSEMTVTVRNPQGGIALPKASDQCEGSPVQELPPGRTPLPVLELEKPDPTLHLTMEGLSFQIKVKNIGIDLLYPEDHFLTRWWVNGKPWMPDPTKIGRMLLRAEAGLMQLSSKGETRVRFDLDFKPERLGVKKGDRVGVQLLFCPEGWGYTDERPEGDPALEPYQNPVIQPLPNFSSPSNRIDFIYSGDPLHPQQTPPK